MKYLRIFFPVAAFILSLVAIYYSKSNLELVYVDVNKLIEGYEKTKKAKLDFDKKTEEMKAEMDSLLADWQKELKNFEKERSRLSANELKLKNELMEHKQNQINNYQSAVQKKIQEENQRETQTLINDINDYVKEYGKKNGYKIIFGASGGGNIMYADDSTDLTEEILKGLNNDYKKK